MHQLRGASRPSALKALPLLLALGLATVGGCGPADEGSTAPTEDIPVVNPTPGGEYNPADESKSAPQAQ